MGCHVASIYSDQMIGKLFYPEQIMKDVTKRDFSPSYKFDDKKSMHQASKNIQLIYGFAQSYCQAFAFSTIIGQSQYLVYNNGRFVIKVLKGQLLGACTSQGGHSPIMSILPHEDQICAMDVNENLCTVGLSGGKLVVWDLSFDQVKIQIHLPKPSTGFSSISLTKQWVFVTDTSTPHNIVYCFDLQTTRLKASGVIDGSLEPTLKGIRFQQNQHIIISASGLQFIKYSQQSKQHSTSHHQQLSITRGMFTTYPKTSQCSITNIDDKYLVSGGVDGYIYIWNSQYECVKAIKCYQQQQAITSIAYNSRCKALMTGSINGKIKCFSFSIKLKPKNTNKTQSTGSETINDNNNNKYPQAMQEDVEYLLTDAVDCEAGVQNLLLSKEDKLLYWSFSRAGSLVAHLLPSNQPYPVKIRSLGNVEIMRFSRRGEVGVQVSPPSSLSSPHPTITLITNMYPNQQNTAFTIDTLILTPTNLWPSISQRSSIPTQKLNPKYKHIYSYCSQYGAVVYLNEENCVVVRFGDEGSGGGVIMKGLVEEGKERLEGKGKQGEEGGMMTMVVSQIDTVRQLIGINYFTLTNHHLTYNHQLTQNLPLINQPQSLPKQPLIHSITYLFITYDDQCLVYEVRNKQQYVLDTSVKFIKGRFNDFIIKLSSFNGFHQLDAKFDDRAKSWRLKKVVIGLNEKEMEDRKEDKIQVGGEYGGKQSFAQYQENIKIQIDAKDANEGEFEELQEYLSKIHTAYLKQYIRTEKSAISIGGSSIMFWSHPPSTSSQ